MSDKWIVTNHRFNEHATLDAAQTERDRLAGESPGKTFRVLRIKTGLRANGSFKEMAELLNAAKEKLALYRAGHSGEYIGGREYSGLIRDINELFAKVDYKPGESK